MPAAYEPFSVEQKAGLKLRVKMAYAHLSCMPSREAEEERPGLSPSPPSSCKSVQSVKSSLSLSLNARAEEWAKNDDDDDDVMESLFVRRHSVNLGTLMLSPEWQL